MPVSIDPPPPRRDRPDNVVRFERPAKKSDPTVSRPAPDLRAAIAGREGWIGLAVIILLAVALVAWNRLGGG